MTDTKRELTQEEIDDMLEAEAIPFPAAVKAFTTPGSGWMRRESPSRDPRYSQPIERLHAKLIPGYDELHLEIPMGKSDLHVRISLRSLEDLAEQGNAALHPEKPQKIST